MAIFNQTFKSDQPIIYPYTWETGKTAVQLFDQMKQTLVYRACICIGSVCIASAWIFVLYIFCYALFEIYKLAKLPHENKAKIENKKFLKKQFIAMAVFINLSSWMVTLMLIYLSDAIFYAIMNGLAVWTCVLIGKYCFEYWKRSKTTHQNSEKQQQRYKKQSRSEFNVKKDD